MRHDELPDRALMYILQGLIPYTEANIKLTFKPNLFFNDLEKIAKRRKQTLRNAYYKAQKSGYIERGADGTPHLTAKGLKRLKRYRPERLDTSARLLVVFDIPEEEAWKRQRLRRLLRELRFVQLQKSVWESEFDHRDLLLAETRQYNLEQHVRIFEAACLYPSPAS
jgi:DNA-binding transcriptional regulator PaaX